jgi:hypothetical protein
MFLFWVFCLDRPAGWDYCLLMLHSTSQFLIMFALLWSLLCFMKFLCALIKYFLVTEILTFLG